MPNENQHIVEVYEEYKRMGVHAPKFFAYRDLANVYRFHERLIKTFSMLKQHNIHSLRGLRILDVGCGDGIMLNQFIHWGALARDLDGIELRLDALESGKTQNPALQLVCGSGFDLPYRTESFDIVCQHTVFAHTPDVTYARKFADEMARVLRVGGIIIWYDMGLSNPRNKTVRGITAREIRSLFDGFDHDLRRISLAPPIARRIPPPAMSLMYPVLAQFPWLCSHYLGILTKR